jgi:SAM-dependent methyltransferase
MNRGVFSTVFLYTIEEPSIIPVIQEVFVKNNSLFEQQQYSLAWVKDFYEQTGIWWGMDPQGDEIHQQRCEIIGRLIGNSPMHILDLGSGPGATAAAMADLGHDVTGIEFSPMRAKFAKKLVDLPRKGKLQIVEDDFYTAELPHTYELITYWDGFGIGTDKDQRRLLKRISHEWLAPGGKVLMDVFNPVKCAQSAGTTRRLPPLKDVEGSVEMDNTWYFDPVSSRWTDEWKPVHEPEKAMAQTLRCYSPVDFQLLLEGTDLKVGHVEAAGQVVLSNNQINKIHPLSGEWSYLVLLERNA